MRILMIIDIPGQEKMTQLVDSALTINHALRWRIYYKPTF